MIVTTGQEPGLASGRPLLSALLARADMQQWAVLRREGDLAVVVALVGEGLELSVGERLPWSATVCARMVASDGPRAVADLATVPDYANAPVARRLGLGAYVGVPIRCRGAVAGALCGLSSGTSASGLEELVALLEGCAELVGRLWEAEGEARTDKLTGLLNRRGWAEVVAREDSRCRRHGLDAAVVAVDLDAFKAVNDRDGHAAGDRYLERTANSLARWVRGHEVLARWGGDEFVVLAVDTTEAQATKVADRLERALSEAGTPGACGIGLCRHGGLERAAEQALEAVGQLKRGRRASSAFGADGAGNMEGDAA